MGHNRTINTTDAFEAKVKARKWIKFGDITMEQWQELLDIIIETSDKELKNPKYTIYYDI